MTQAVVEMPLRGVFLSYSSRDRGVAVKLKAGLERLGVAVHIDIDALEPGQDIREFILQAIRTTAATVLIVSEASIASDWVAIEVNTSLVDIELNGSRKFFPCSLDDGFVSDPEYRARATELVRARIEAIDRRIIADIENKTDSADLHAERSRLFKLLSGLPELLRRLHETKCVDLRGEHFDASIVQLANVLRPLAPGKSQAALSAASDIEQRQAEIYGLVENGDGDRALKRVMDFIHDFCEDKRKSREITFALGEFRRLEQVQDRTLREIRLERREILRQALDLLDETIEMLTKKRVA